MTGSELDRKQCEAGSCQTPENCLVVLAALCPRCTQAPRYPVWAGLSKQFTTHQASSSLLRREELFALRWQSLSLPVTAGTQKLYKLPFFSCHCRSHLRYPSSSTTNLCTGEVRLLHYKTLVQTLKGGISLLLIY